MSSRPTRCAKSRAERLRRLGQLAPRRPLTACSARIRFVHALALRVDLRIPLVNSLKEKRGVLRRIRTGVRKFDVAVAEVDFQDAHRRAALGIAMVSGSSHQLERVRHGVERWLDAQPGIEVISIEVGYLVPE